ncbi:MAG: hypothetical protein D6739_04600 [Nitrospirae bacterium]|nr:MAG: hypothetical protein D6739_04600 [Nitrospirota bacterium]
MIAAGLLLAAAAQVAPAATPHVPSPRAPVAARVIRTRTVFAEERVALILVERREQGLVRLGARAARMRWSALRLPVPLGDGVWAVLLDRKLRPLASYPSAAPERLGERCDVEVPIRRGIWWLLLLRRHGDDTTILGRIEVGPDLARLALSGQQEGDVADVGAGGAGDQRVPAGGQGGS